MKLITSSVLYLSQKEPINEDDERAIISALALAHAHIDYIRMPSLIRKILFKKPYNILFVKKFYYKFTILPFINNEVILINDYFSEKREINIINFDVNIVKKLCQELGGVPFHYDNFSLFLSYINRINFFIHSVRQKTYNLTFIQSKNRELIEEIITYLIQLPELSSTLNNEMQLKHVNSQVYETNLLKDFYEKYEYLRSALSELKDTLNSSCNRMKITIEKFFKPYVANLNTYKEFRIQLEFPDLELVSFNKLKKPLDYIIENIKKKIDPQITEIEEYYKREIRTLENRKDEQINSIKETYSKTLNILESEKFALLRKLQADINIVKKRKEKLNKRIQMLKKNNPSTYNSSLSSDSELTRLQQKFTELSRHLKLLKEEYQKAESDYNEKIKELHMKQKQELQRIEEQFNNKITLLQEEKRSKISEKLKPIHELESKMDYFRNLLEDLKNTGKKVRNARFSLDKHIAFHDIWDDKRLIDSILDFITFVDNSISSIINGYIDTINDTREYLEECFIRFYSDEAIEIYVPFWVIGVKKDPYSIEYRLISPSVIHIVNLDKPQKDYLLRISFIPLFPSIHELLEERLYMLLQNKSFLEDHTLEILENVHDIITSDHWLVSKNVIHPKLYTEVVKRLKRSKR